MKVPVALNGVLKESEIEFVGRPKFDFLDQWKAYVRQDKHPLRTDAVDFAALACKRFRTHFPSDNYVDREKDIFDHIKNNPNCEVAALVLMRSDWFSPSPVIGLVHFRRSWCNNLILDYLSVHPWIASPPTDFPDLVRGTGTGLLYYLADLAGRLQCGALWGEATQNSCDFYRGVFDLEPVRDLVYIEQEKLARFVKELGEKWRRAKDEHEP